MYRGASKSQIQLFLEGFKKFTKADRLNIYRGKTKNLETIFALGISIQECIEHLLDLTPEDFVGITAGEKIRSKPGGWVFRKTIRGREIYIRLRIDTENGWAICESFHFWEEPPEAE